MPRGGRYAMRLQAPANAKSTSGFSPLTMRAMLLPEPQECVQPSVPWPVLRNSFAGLLRPMIGTLLGVAGRRPVQNCACVVTE